MQMTIEVGGDPNLSEQIDGWLSNVDANEAPQPTDAEAREMLQGDADLLLVYTTVYDNQKQYMAEPDAVWEGLSIVWSVARMDFDKREDGMYGKAILQDPDLLLKKSWGTWNNDDRVTDLEFWLRYRVPNIYKLISRLGDMFVQ